METGFIIDSYSRFDRFDREHTKFVFTIQETEYAIKEVEIVNGRPNLPPNVQGNEYEELCFVYESYEKAMNFVKLMKKLN